MKTLTWCARTCSLALIFCVTSLTACYHYRVQAPGAAGVGVTQPKSEIVWSFAWGFVQEQPIIECNEQPLAEVHNSTNFAFILLTVVSIGFASPQRVEWTCAPPRPTEGELDAADAGETEAGESRAVGERATSAGKTEGR